MAPRSEQFHAEQERLAREKKAKRAKRARAKKDEKAHAKTRTEGKATYAREENAAPGKRPSRKSTRKSANRAKPDASLSRVEAAKKGSPDAKFRKGKAAIDRVRGAPRG
jgi:hypothetical protein